MKKNILLVLLFLMLQILPTHAAMEDFKKYFEVDFNAPLPDIKALEKELTKATAVFNPRYIMSWDMGPVFDKIWAATIWSYGTSEKRIINPAHENLYDLIKTIPAQYYPYIGPALHASAGIPEKILNMPGIKETKNKFPERIAPQLQGLEDLEFLSPHLYILLMPEMWPDNQKPIEFPRTKPAKAPKIDYNPEFYAKVLAAVPDEGFGTAARNDNQPGRDKLRTLKITKDSLLTTADIKAFLGTIDSVKTFGTLENKLKIIRAGHLMDFWERKNGTALALNGLKDMVNPCQRMVLKIKWADLTTEFAKAVAGEGFTPEEWAYTCDKTIKAYRISNVTAPKIAAMQEYKKGLYDNYINALRTKWKDNQFATMQSILEMHKAPREDVMTALKNESLIKDKIVPLGGMLVTAPISN